MCKCNHKSRKDERRCCCTCHGKSNMHKECAKKEFLGDSNMVINKGKDTHYEE
jgi:hypothetical protein